MKRILAVLIALIYSSTNICLSANELYYLKNVKKDTIKPIIEESYIDNNFVVLKEDPYYGVSYTGSDIAVIIIQQSGENMFYYYEYENNEKINKSVLKKLKKQNIVYEQSFNQNLIDIYDNLADGFFSKSGTTKKYSFDEEEEPDFAKNNSKNINNDVLKGYVTQLNAGTKLNVYLQNAINTSIAKQGDKVVAVVSHNLTYNGKVIIPQGSIVYGNLSKARSATYGSRNGRVIINFNQVVTPENQVYNISTEAIDFAVANEGKIQESAKNALGSAAAGAIAGLLFALMSDKNVGSAMAIGAGVGAGASVVKSTAEKGVDAEIPSFTEFELILTQPLNISVSNL